MYVRRIQYFMKQFPEDHGVEFVWFTEPERAFIDVVT